MHLIVNGEPRELPGPLTAAQLLEQLGLRREVVVIEHNEQVIERGRLETLELHDGDTLEIIQMIAGG